LPRRVEDLDHHGSYTLSVTEDSSKIRLHDIVMGPVRGRGFGTSLLQELCRSADHRSLPIVCEVVVDSPSGLPLKNSRQSAEAMSADSRRGHHRHGFRTEKPLDDWRSHTKLHREPSAHYSIQ
jgi:hypothetical protein